MTLRIRKLRSNGDERVEAIHLRHLHVHQRHVRTVRAELLDRFPTVGGFCDHGHIRLNPHETGDPFAHQWMVVDRENANSRLPPVMTRLLLPCAGVFGAKQP